jgi:RNA 3'-phosphate cyclase
MLPAAIASGERVVVRLRGGTDVPTAPPVDYLRLVLLPLLARMGARAGLELVRRGYYPRGGGDVRLTLEPVARLQPLRVEDRGATLRFETRTHVARLPLHVARRMEGAACALLPAGVPVESSTEVCPDELAAGPGGAIVLRAVCAHGVLGAAEVAQRGVPAERLGQAAARSLRRDLEAGASLDGHAADQMLVFQALCEGPSIFRAAPLSAHATTAMWLLERLAAARFDARPAAAGVVVHVHPALAGPRREPLET